MKPPYCSQLHRATGGGAVNKYILLRGYNVIPDTQSLLGTHGAECQTDDLTGFVPSKNRPESNQIAAARFSYLKCTWRMLGSGSMWRSRSAERLVAGAPTI